MLIELRVENHRSIRDEQVFTMEAGRLSRPEDPHVRAVERHKSPLVTVAAFYGANASGKSNLLSALAFMCEAVASSHRYWEPAGGVPRDPFAWGKSRREPSLYEVTFLRGGLKYQYGFVINDERVLEEWLYAWPGSRKQTWFEREDKFKFGENLKGENRAAEEVTRKNALLVSVAAQHGHEQLTEVYKWFSEATFENTMPYNFSLTAKWQMASTVRRLEMLAQALGDPIPPSGKELEHLWPTGLKHFLTAADVGIIDIKVERSAEPTGEEIYFRHHSDVTDAWLPLSQESAGTKSLLRIAAPVLNALTRGGLLVVDELEQSLHPLLALYILEQFNSPETNPKNAQLIFTTHDTNLLGTTLGEPTLARDQVWLTEKDQTGGTVVYPLTDYKPRTAENIERGYLQGRYGAIPFLGSIEKLVE
jgi:AAA15 family ATPase/GTPase